MWVFFHLHDALLTIKSLFFSPSLISFDKNQISDLYNWFIKNKYNYGISHDKSKWFSKQWPNTGLIC